MNAVSNDKRPTLMAFYIRPTGTQICRGFKVHDLITCKSKVQGVVSLGRHWVLTNGTWHVLLQSGNVFELGSITILHIALYWLCFTKKLNTTDYFLDCQVDETSKFKLSTCEYFKLLKSAEFSLAFHSDICTSATFKFFH